jgi:YD repeat-containing protein
MTASAWVYLNSAPTGRAAVASRQVGTGSDDHYFLGADGTSARFCVRTGVGFSDCNVGQDLSVGAWHHLAGTYDGSNTRLYVDGALAFTSPESGTIASDTTPLIVGGNINSAGGPIEQSWPGIIDNLRLYKTAVTAPEIALLAGEANVSSADIQAPTAPSGLNGSAASSTQINLSWTGSTDDVAVTAYVLERCQDTICTNFGVIATLTSTSFSDAGLTPGTTYRYRVRARDGASNYSGYAGPTNITTQLLPGTGGKQAFFHDDLGRLTSGNYSDTRSTAYQYDPAGNRFTMLSGTPPELSIGNATAVTEGATLSFPVTRQGSSLSDITVECVPANGTAVAGGAEPFNDYDATPKTIVFHPADPSPSTKNCTVQTLADNYYEGAQTLTATLLNAQGARIVQPNTASGSILDNDASPTFSITGSSSVEGAPITFTITKTGLTEQAHSVSYATGDGSATSGDSDYTATGATPVNFASGQTSQSIVIQTTADSKYEANETFTVSLSSATNGSALGSPASATGTITNNDGAPEFVIDDPAIVTEGGIVSFTVSNVGNAATQFAHSLSWSTANGTAAASSDYTAASGTISFSNGELTKSIQIQTLLDGVFEGSNETFVVNLAANGSTNGAAINDAQGVGTIADIDNPVPSVPQNIRKVSTPHYYKNYGIFWDASTGPVAYYVLEEAVDSLEFNASYTVNSPLAEKAFNNKPTGEYYYRVKACSAANVCSGYSSSVFKLVCNGPCN